MDGLRVGSREEFGDGVLRADTAKVPPRRDGVKCPLAMDLMYSSGVYSDALSI
jgi:hypothetical protein